MPPNRKGGMKSDPSTWACGYEADLSMETLASTVGANVKTFRGRSTPFATA